MTGDNIRGTGSGTFETVSDKINVDSLYDIAPVESVVRGWNKETVNFSINEQRLIDSDYYQYFSYSLKSKIAFDTWNDIVSSMAHPGGFKKFSDLQIESKDDNSKPAGISSSTLDLFVDLISEVETYCQYDFDIVSETSKSISGEFVSDEILMRILLLLIMKNQLEIEFFLSIIFRAHLIILQEQLDSPSSIHSHFQELVIESILLNFLTPSSLELENGNY